MSTDRSNVLAPAGPAWAGSLMGTSIAATLTHIHGVPVLPWLFAFTAAVICAVIVVGWLRHRNPGFAHTLMGPWGMLAMGVLALGSAWTAVTGSDAYQLVTWWIGTALAVVVCLNQLRGFAGRPTFQWGLALVAPMVGATGGGQLAEHGAVYWWVGAGCFALSLATGVPVFARAYADVVRGKLKLPGQLAGTAWIPLGIVGQSTAAAHVLFGGQFAVVYGAVLLSVGVPLILYAMSQFYPAVARWAGYSPGWWGSTFPTGTLSLGTRYMALTTGIAAFDLVSAGFLALLLAHWAICAARFAAWVASHYSAAPRSVAAARS